MCEFHTHLVYRFVLPNDWLGDGSFPVETVGIKKLKILSEWYWKRKTYVVDIKRHGRSDIQGPLVNTLRVIHDFTYR